MGWRENMGISQMIPNSKTLAQYSQYPQIEKGENQIANIANNAKAKSEPAETVLNFNGPQVRRVAVGPATSKLKIEKMTRCLHGQSCEHLDSQPPARPICDVAGMPVFDLTECPLMGWASKQPNSLQPH